MLEAVLQLKTIKCCILVDSQRVCYALRASITHLRNWLLDSSRNHFNNFATLQMNSTRRQTNSKAFTKSLFKFKGNA